VISQFGERRREVVFLFASYACAADQNGFQVACGVNLR